MFELVPEIQERKSLTNWSSQSITAETWELLMEAARRAPSSWNHQPARYIIVEAGPTRNSLHQTLHRTNAWAEKAAALVVQLAAPEDDDRIDGKEYYLFDCGLAMMSLIYQAQALGITSRQMIGWDENAVKHALSIPERYRVVVITGLGYPSTYPISKTIATAKRNVTEQGKRYAVDHLFFRVSFGKE